MQMKGLLLSILIITATSFLEVKGSEYFPVSAKPLRMAVLDPTISIPWAAQESARIPIKPLNEIQAALPKLAPTLSAKVINTVITALKCASKNDVDHNHILAVIDYSLPSNEKRLWVFDLAQNKLLFNTYVSHGIQSGTLSSTHFSNQYNAKASSIGIFNTEKVYRGRHGVSLKLYGLDKDFNDNAYKRSIVMHGAWYVEEWFIKKYGRPGRSWGCPVLPYDLTKSIIDTIKDKALLVVYYPSNEWFAKSKFLNCEIGQNSNAGNPKIEEKAPVEATQREAILYVDTTNHSKREENEPIIVISADNYKHIFNKEVPLERMLRRQINKIEYIALTNNEFKQLNTNGKWQLDIMYFVVPIVKMQRGWYVTEMEVMPLGKINSITPNPAGNYTIHFDNRAPAEIKTDDRFIRWLGL
jgi:hypothetical protein